MNHKLRLMLIGIVAVGIVAADVYILNTRKLSAQAPHEMSSIPVITKEELTKFDGSDPAKPVLLAMDGYVYDVSAGRANFYDPGKPYHKLAGTDASALLHLAGGEIVKRKYEIVGRLK